MELNRAECEYLTGQLPVAQERLAALSERATTTIERAFVACLRIDVYLTLAAARSLFVSNISGMSASEWSPHPTEEDVRREYERIRSLLGSRTIEELIDLPLMDDPATLATVEVLSRASSPSAYTDVNLAALTICKAISLGLEYGNCDASGFAYVMLAMVAGPRFGEYQAGFRFGQLGYELVERRGLKRFEASPGLGPATLENLFKAFHTTKPNGLGLGLSICRSIVDGHGGRLWASTNLPRGAVFQFTLPISQDVSAPQ